MLKILDLFAGTQSTRKAIELMTIEYDYKGVDIYSPEEENIIFDLSQDNIVEKLKEVLGDWKPDIIWASPLCTTFSRATCIKNGTLSYVLENEQVRIRRDEEFDYITHRNYVAYKDNPEWRKEQQNKGLLGLKLMKCNHKGQHKANMSGSSKRTPNAKAICGNKDRSKVPPKLIREIFKQLLGENV